VIFATDDDNAAEVGRSTAMPEIAGAIDLASSAQEDDLCRCWSGGAALVAVVKATDLGQRHDLAHAWWLDRPWLGRILAQREMRARLVIVRKISFQNSMEMALAEDDHMVETFSTYGAHQAFGVRILPR